MKNEQLYQVLLAPVVSEKSAVAAVGGKRQYIFKVAAFANRANVKKAVEHLFNVTVDSVRVCNMKAKPKRFGQIYGRTKVWKKAYVTLASGSEIDVTGMSA